MRRLLVVTYGNWNFVNPVVDHYEAMPTVEVRRLDVSDRTTPSLPLSANKLVNERLFGPADARSQPWAANLAGQLDWCDTVWVEWGHRTAVLLSLLDPGTTRVVVRLHSYEIFTAFPQMVDWSRVDDLVLVGDHLRTFVEQVVPAVTSGPSRHVLPNAMDLQRFAVAKDSTARHVIGLIGWSVVAKDPIWALDVLARLREHDPAYRLMLVGHPFDATVSVASGQYGARLAARLARSDVAGAVVRAGQTSDVPKTLQGIGTILSSSVREAAPQSVVEGAASGAVPVVRNWPMLARYGGAHAIFPDSWVVDNVDAAAQRIIDMTGDEQTWRDAGDAASAHAMEKFDWVAVAPQYDRLLRA
jgi:glycosyltransferase involved in cell wall biosynthesis